MIHFSLLVGSLLLAWIYRWSWRKPQVELLSTWPLTVSTFVLPPLLLLISAVAIVWMGPDGVMASCWMDQLSYFSSLGFLIYASGLCLNRTRAGWQTLVQIKTYPKLPIPTRFQSGRLLKTSLYFAAQIGFWHPILVISEGLLQSLDPTHIEAILAHEEAHLQYRDPYIFFWLGWLRTLTPWLPNTQVLWEELLVLREIRADQWAAQRVDPLTLAESLVMVVSDQMAFNPTPCAATISLDMQGMPLSPSRFEERINALLVGSTPVIRGGEGWWMAWLSVLMPLLLVPFHH